MLLITSPCIMLRMKARCAALSLLMQASRRRLVPTMVAPSVSTTSRQDSPQLPQAHPQLVGMAPSAEAQLSERLQGAMQLSSGGVGRDDDPFTPPTASMGTWDSRPRAADGMLGPSSTSQRLESRLEEVDADRQGCSPWQRPRYMCKAMMPPCLSTEDCRIAVLPGHLGRLPQGLHPMIRKVHGAVMIAFVS